MLWAGNDLCWTALSQTISLNDAEEEPFNLSWKLINFSPCLSCVCVRARKCGRQPVRESRLSVRVLIVFPHARGLSDGSKHPDTTALYQRQGATSQIYYRVSWGPLHGPVPRPDVFFVFFCWAIRAVSLCWQKATDAEFSQASRKQPGPAKNREKQMDAAERAD